MAKRERSGKRPGKSPALPVDGAFSVTCWLDLKDYLACELQKEKIEAAKIEVETAKTQRDQARGRLMSVDQVRARDERLALAIKSGLSSVSEMLTEFVPADRLLDAQKRAREWVDTVLCKVADAVEGKP